MAAETNKRATLIKEFLANVPAVTCPDVGGLDIACGSRPGNAEAARAGSDDFPSAFSSANISGCGSRLASY